MSLRPTTLVLGAGASVDYGFPTGRKLVIEVCEKLKQRNDDFTEKMERIAGFDYKALSEFGSALDMSMLPSVDAFVERRPEFLNVGKAAIACSLMPKENPDNLRQRREDVHFYEYLFGIINSENVLENGNLSIVTFNYDRSLEAFLFSAILNAYGTDEQKTLELLDSIPVVHVYGSLGKFVRAETDAEPEGRNYDPTVDVKPLQIATKGIKILSEAEDTSPELERAKELLRQANTICFLGFGYHPRNIERLGINDMDHKLQITRIHVWYGRS